MMFRRLVLLLCVFLAPVAAGAVEPDEILSDPALEARAREIGKNLRCLVCQNQSIDDSNAALAKDLRVLVRERLVAGDSNDETIEFVVARYGDYVLLKPPFKSTTYLLWFGPLLLLALALLGVWGFYRSQRVARPAAAALSEDQQDLARKLLKDDPQ